MRQHHIGNIQMNWDKIGLIYATVFTLSGLVVLTIANWMIPIVIFLSVSFVFSIFRLTYFVLDWLHDRDFI